MSSLMPNGTPAASDTAGQQPNSDAQTSETMNHTASLAQGTPAAPSGDNEASTAETQPQTAEVANPAAQKASQEAAKYRAELRAAQQRLAEYEAAQRAAEEAQMSELEKAQKRLAEYQQREAQTQLQAQERITRAEVRAEATRLGLNPQLASRIVDYSAIEYSEDGDPTNIAQLLSEAINAYGLNPQPAQSAQATLAAPAVGATNPARPSGPLTITPSQYSDTAFRQQYMRDFGEDILAAVTKGKVKIV